MIELAVAHRPPQYRDRDLLLPELLAVAQPAALSRRIQWESLWRGHWGSC